MKTVFLAGMIYSILLAGNGFAAEVGIIDSGGEYSSKLDKVVETVEILGHDATKLPIKELLNPEKLHKYDCVILAHRSGSLSEKEYQAINNYVLDGGTLLITGLSAFWMKTPEGPREKVRILGEGPFKETVGVKITDCREVAIKRMKVVNQDNSAVKGLPESFIMQTVPAYKPESYASWRSAGVYPLKTTTATTLIKVETVDKKGKKAKSDFLTVKWFGLGECYRLAISNLATVIRNKREKHIALIINNILKN